MPCLCVLTLAAISIIEFQTIEGGYRDEEGEDLRECKWPVVGTPLQYQRMLMKSSEDTVAALVWRGIRRPAVFSVSFL